MGWEIPCRFQPLFIFVLDIKISPLESFFITHDMRDNFGIPTASDKLVLLLVSCKAASYTESHG